MPPKPASLNRRNFLKTSIGGSAILAASSNLATDVRAAAQKPAVSTLPLPTRKLGRTGARVSMINLGTGWAPDPRMLEIAWQNGVRYFDTADCYANGKAEANIRRWLEAHPERRKDLFLVTKDHPKQPKDLLEQVDRRLETLGTDYIDLFFIHWIQEKTYGPQCFDWPRSDEMKRVAEKLKATGKIKLFGFSCHSSRRPRFMTAAAEGGFMDALMVSYSPFPEPEGEMDRALDACAEAGVGIIAMKTMRGAVATIPRRIPEFDKLGLTAHQGVLQAVWSDERIASICSAMDTVEKIEENTAAARQYDGPLKTADRRALREAVLTAGLNYCPDCADRVAEAAGKPELALGDIARFVNYYEVDGTLEARDWYRALPTTARDATGADLSAATGLCGCGVDYARVLNKARRYFA